MRRSLILTLVLAACLLTGVNFVLADAGDKYGLGSTQSATGGLVPKTVAGASSIPQLVGKVVAILLSLLGIIFFLLIFYSGLTWMLSRGNSDGTTKAKDTLEAAVVGLIVVMGSYAISRFVFDKLGAGTSSSSVTSLVETQAECTAVGGACQKDSCNSTPLGVCNDMPGQPGICCK